MPSTFRRSMPGPSAALLLSLLAGDAAAANATIPEPYAVSRAQAAATDCLRRQPAVCEAELARYLDLATALLDDVREAWPGQELRLRATRSQLQRDVVTLRGRAVAELDPQLQTQAAGLERAIEAIDVLLGRGARMGPPLVPPPIAAAVRVIDVIEPARAALAPAPLPPTMAALPPLPLTDAR